MENVLVDIVTYMAVGVVLGIGAIGIYVWFFLYLPIRNRIDQVVSQLVQQAHDNLVGLEIEVDQGVYFCYNSEDKQFVCQGATASEVRAAFRARCPDKTAYIASGDPAVVEQFRAELTQLSLHENSPSV
jgi:hypothetical protein